MTQPSQLASAVGCFYTTGLAMTTMQAIGLADAIRAFNEHALAATTHAQHDYAWWLFERRLHTLGLKWDGQQYVSCIPIENTAFAEVA